MTLFNVDMVFGMGLFVQYEGRLALISLKQQTRIQFREITPQTHQTVDTPCNHHVEDQRLFQSVFIASLLDAHSTAFFEHEEEELNFPAGHVLINELVSFFQSGNLTIS